MGKQTVAVSGIWIRKRGTGEDAEAEVLAEVRGEFRSIFSTKLERFTDGEVSCIVEPAGIEDAPRDSLARCPVWSDSGQRCLRQTEHGGEHEGRDGLFSSDVSKRIEKEEP